MDDSITVAGKGAAVRVLAFGHQPAPAFGGVAGKSREIYGHVIILLTIGA
jgi:hypothetical protein